MAGYLAGVDMGTTGARCAIFDLEGRRIASEYREYGATYPKPGWVEQDVDELIAQTMAACQATIASAKIDAGRILSVAFSTQRCVTCPVHADGSPVRPMISWQDARTGAEVEHMRTLVDPADYYATSGLPLGTTWIITKLLWMRANEPDRLAQTHKIVQNQDVVLRAFGADGFFTDLSDMAFYGAWDVRQAAWSRSLLDRFGVSESYFGTPTPSGTKVGTVSPAVAAKTGFKAGTPICVGAGDQNCAVIGMGAIRGGMGTVTLGTAGLAILAVDRPVPGFGGMMVTNHVVPGMWEVEGLSNAAAASYRWWRDLLGDRELAARDPAGSAYKALDALAAQAAPGAKGLLYLPYLATAGTPRWNAQARAAFIGMSLSHGRAEMTRAVMEGVCLEIRDMTEQWLTQGMPLDVLRIGGGATKSALWNQIQADVYGRPVQTLREGETTVLGAAILAGVGAGVFASVQDGVAAMVQVAAEIQPDPVRHRLYTDLYGAYVQAYQGLADGGAFAALAEVQAR
ncbi:MAG: FGGY family carbohydrate kinase [Lentisphaeria bacterium]